MLTGSDSSWHDSLISVGWHRRTGTEQVYYAALEAGRLHRLGPGVAMSSELWDALKPEAQHRAVVRATWMRYPSEGPYSHLSAVALWELPILDPLPPRAEVLAPRTTGGRSRRGLARHCLGVPDRIEQIDGLPVTELARSVIDACAVSSFSAGVALADAALAGAAPGFGTVASIRTTGEELLAEFEAATFSAGRARCRRVLDFADGRSGSAGESWSRAAIHFLGFPPPQLQVRFADAFGLIGVVDFYWEEYGVIGEFDGFGKYLREELRNGRTAAQVVVDEKVREDRLRACGPRVTRWGWSELRSFGMLERKLRAAGLPQRRRF